MKIYLAQLYLDVIWIPLPKIVKHGFIFQRETPKRPKRPKDCKELFQNGAGTNGNYTIYTDTEQFNVYCDFTSDKPFVWTLVYSFSLKNKNAVQALNLLFDLPVDEDNPNWAKYRLSKKRMEWLRSTSTYWRITCSFSTYGVDYRDYVRANMTDIDPLVFFGFGLCAKVCINIHVISPWRPKKTIAFKFHTST